MGEHPLQNLRPDRVCAALLAFFSENLYPPEHVEGRRRSIARPAALMKIFTAPESGLCGWLSSYDSQEYGWKIMLPDHQHHCASPGAAHRPLQTTSSIVHRQ